MRVRPTARGGYDGSVRRLLLTPLLAACALALAPAAPAQVRSFPGTAAVHASGSKPASPIATLHRAEAAFRGRTAGGKHDLSPLLKELAAQLPELRGAARKRALSLLARPTDGAADPDGAGWTAPEAAQSPLCSAHYCVHWVTTSADAPDQRDGNGNGIPDWVETVDQVAENVYSVENGQLAWRAPKSDGTNGGGSGLIDIYLANIGGTGVYGYTAPDPGQHLTKRDHSESAYLVIDNDFSKAEFSQYSDSVTPLEVTLAHEYNHVLQFNYDALEDIWMFESTAVWMEGRVYEPVHDYLQYMDGWSRLTQRPLTSFNGNNPNDRQNVKVYGSAVWNKWLDAQFGPEVVRRAWEDSLAVKPQSFAPGAYDAAIRQHGGAGFKDQFDRFAAATAEWQAPNSGFPEGSLYPDVLRAGTLRIDGAPGSIRLDHTSYALVDVPVRSAGRVKLAAIAPSGTSGAIALVGRSGNTATSFVKELPKGGAGTVVVPNPGSFDRLTAVLVNSDISQRGYSNAARDWRWKRDNQLFYGDASTDFARPKVRSRSPKPDSGAGRRPKVTVTFSEPMVGVSASTLRLIGPGGRKVHARVSFKTGKRKATLVPSRGLRAGRYRVQLSPKISDLALNHLRTPAPWAFRVR